MRSSTSPSPGFPYSPPASTTPQSPLSKEAQDLQHLLQTRAHESKLRRLAAEPEFIMMEQAIERGTGWEVLEQRRKAAMKEMVDEGVRWGKVSEREMGNTQEMKRERKGEHEASECWMS